MRHTTTSGHHGNHDTVAAAFWIGIRRERHEERRPRPFIASQLVPNSARRRPAHRRLAARRHHDGARAAFTGDYLREHITTATPSPSTPHNVSPPTRPTRSSAKTPPAHCCTPP
jgi:hypothetical protein